MSLNPIYAKYRETTLARNKAKVLAAGIQKYGTEEAYRAALRDLRAAAARRNFSGRGRPRPQVTYEARLLAAAAAHPAVLDFVLSGVLPLHEEYKKKAREYTRAYDASPEGRLKKKQGHQRRAEARRPRLSSWPLPVIRWFLDAVISGAEQEALADDETDCRAALSAARRTLVSGIGPEEYERLTRKYDRIAWKNRPAVRVVEGLRNRLRGLLKKRGFAKAEATLALVGCSPDELRQHIERQFADGMSWDNYGSPSEPGGKAWHVDHIKPCAKFDFTDQKQQAECFHFSNLQPLWGEDNLRKGATYAA